MKRSAPYLVVALAVLGALSFAVLRSQRAVREDDGPASRHPVASGARPAADPAASRRRSTVDVLRAGPESAIDLAQRPLPRSLEGTEVDGGLAADPEGHLIVGPGVRALFDYFLSATGEEPAELIRARIIAEIEARLPPTAAREAIELLDRYLEYRERGRDLWAADEMHEDLDARLQRVRDLRRDVFGEKDAEALFGPEEQQDYVAVAQRQIARDPTLSEAERERRIAELEQQLPEEVRLAREEALKPLRFLEEQARLQSEGAPSEEIRALREAYFGADAADRLEALDREQVEWRQRIDQYRAARRVVEENSALTEPQRADAVNELLAQRFTPNERLRVEALDRIEQPAAAP